MVAVLVVLDLHVPAVGSLKGKRGVVKQLIARLRKELNVSVAEVGHQDLWQRCELGVAIAAGSETGARQVAQSVEKIVYREPRVDLLSIHVEVVVPEVP
ncbi:MAG: DUF503 domain-containing protein [Euzebyaceae bacterium]|jgi:uncharacterized protein YlxP (DUF503 family)|nr:DUF503 domain-containing protein [Euzebyaceae bacterium]